MITRPCFRQRFSACCRLYCVIRSHSLLALSIAVFVFAAKVNAQPTPLDEYVAAPDAAFKYTEVAVNEKDDCTTTIYHLVSQTWLDDTKVDRPLWEHTVLVTVPKELKFTKAMMFVGGGGHRTEEERRNEDNGPLERIAVMTGSVVAQVKQIPNQPLHFVGDTMEKYLETGRKEDEMITFGWDKYLTAGDPVWLARLPMTKAVVRAMDLTQKEFPHVDGFFVAGGSKRGWTAWTVAAVDNRVFGIAPAVIDVLNFEPSLANHYAAYGFWAPAISDYVEMDIFSRMGTLEFRNLLAVVDPYSYRNRLTMPKYIINSAGDQFFTPDSSKFYFDELKGEKFLCYVPNTDHGLNADAYFQLASFYQMLMAETPLPRFTWEKAPDGTLTVTCETIPDKVLQWTAHNPDARDFRLATLGPKYESVPLEESRPGVYTSNVKPAEKGWTAYFIELEYINPGFSMPLKVTTGVTIVPDTYPGAGAGDGAEAREDKE